MNATQYSAEARVRLQDIINYLRDGVNEVDDIQAKALFETSAEVLGGLKKAFADFERGNEAAWQRQKSS